MHHSPAAACPLVSAGGKVVFGYDTVRTFPEWWGAAGNGAANDAPAIQAAFDAAAASSAAMLYLSGKTYGLGNEVTFTNGANVMSEPSARFVAGEEPHACMLFTAGRLTL
jgi:hypothetical protein